MCEFLSGITTNFGSSIKNYHSLKTNSHSEIEEEFGIRDTISNIGKICKWEYTSATPQDLDSYTLRCDERIEPDWWDDYKVKISQYAKRQLKRHMITKDCEVKSGSWFVFEGSPVITQSGGDIFTYDSSSPVITQSGGYIRACSNSSPVITQSGGNIFTYESSSPVITKKNIKEK